MEIAACALLGWAAAYFLHVEEKTLQLLLTLSVTVFPVLFGVSLTIIAIVGALDSTTNQLPWRSLQIYKRTFESKMLRQCLVASLYLLEVLMAFALTFIPCGHAWFPLLSKVFIGLGLMAILLSFGMPFSLFFLFSERYKLLLQARGAPQPPAA